MSVLRRFLSTPEGIAGAVILLVLALTAVLAPALFPRDPLAIAGTPLLPPFQDWSLPLGTDRLGRDVLAGVVHGARTSLAVALAAAAMSIVVGAVVGTAAGFSGGIVDEVLMRIADAFQTVPGFLLALAFVSTIGVSTPVIVLAIALGAWADPARLTRAQVLVIREADYVASARVIGMHPAEMAFREILPNALMPVLVLSATIVAGAILTEAALSFLGLGNPNLATWGSMIAEGRSVLRSASYLSIIPGSALAVTVLGVHLFSEGLGKALGSHAVRV